MYKPMVKLEERVKNETDAIMAIAIGELVISMWTGYVELVMAGCLAVRLGEDLNDEKIRLLLLA